MGWKRRRPSSASRSSDHRQQDRRHSSEAPAHKNVAVAKGRSIYSIPKMFVIGRIFKEEKREGLPEHLTRSHFIIEAFIDLR